MAKTMKYITLLSRTLFLPSIMVGNEQASNGMPDSNTKLVLIGMRHGNRNPVKFLPDDPNKGEWGHEGPEQLTSIGKRQACAVGKKLRDSYGFLISEYFMPVETKALSSSAERCQMTLQSAMNGLFPPTRWADWQPVPYTIDNPLLRMYAVDCPAGDAGWAPITDDNLPQLAQQIDREKDIISYVAQNTGWNGSLSNMADVADNLTNLEMLGLPLPDWVANPSLTGYDGDKLYAKILEFAENHQIACARYAPCGDMMAGYWLNHVLQILRDKRDGNANDLHLVAYVSHTEVILSLMKLIKMDYDEVAASAGVIIEYREEPQPAVRLLNHAPNEENPDERHIEVARLNEPCIVETGGCIAEPCIVPLDWCPLDMFIARVEAKAFSDWQAACEVNIKLPTGSASVDRADVSSAENTKTMVIDCDAETDSADSADCATWAANNYCGDYQTVKYIHCRKTCLCA